MENSRIKQAFANKAKVAYLTAGVNGVGKSTQDFLAIIDGGVNIIEVGIPFSDPVVDGDIIQEAMKKAISVDKITLDDVLKVVSNVRVYNNDVAIILFTYYNPVYSNLELFVKNAKLAGADGILLVDLPFEEAAEFYYLCNKYQINPVVVVAPSTSAKRLVQLLEHIPETSFIYYACQKGTTGIRGSLPSDLNTKLQQIRIVSKLPIAVGFGISNSEMVARVLQYADGCVVGSYLVKAACNSFSNKQLTEITKSLFNINGK